jgi:hypothetical protein
MLSHDEKIHKDSLLRKASTSISNLSCETLLTKLKTFMQWLVGYRFDSILFLPLSGIYFELLFSLAHAFGNQ